MRDDQLIALLKRLAATAAEGGSLPAPLPEAVQIPWQWFADLHRTRSVTGLGPGPISYAEIDAYARSMRLALRPHHVRMIRALDDAWLGALGQKKDAPAAPLTAAAFDAMFG